MDMSNQQLTKGRVSRQHFFPYPSKADSKVMRKRVFLCIAIFLFLVSGFISTLFSAYCTENLANTELVTTTTIQGSPLGIADTQQVLDASILKDDMPAYVLWEQRSEEYVLNPFLERTSKVNIVLAEGSTELLVEGAFLPAGEWLAQRHNVSEDLSAAEPAPQVAVSGDAVGPPCIIDANTALILFGDTDVVGLSVIYNDEEFIIYNVVESPRPLLLIRPTEQTNTAFDMATVQNNPDMLAERTIESFSVGLGLEVQTLTYDLLYHLARLICWLPILLLSMLYLIFMLRQGISKKNETRFQIVFLLGFLVSLLVFCGYIATFIQIPRELIPSKVSDFSLWQQIFTEASNSMGDIFDAPIFAPTAQWTDSFSGVIISSVVSLALYIGAVWLLSRIKLDNYIPRFQIKQKEVDAKGLLAKRSSSRIERSATAPRYRLYDDLYGGKYDTTRN